MGPSVSTSPSAPASASASDRARSRSTFRAARTAAAGRSMKWACAPCATAQDSACHSGEKTAIGQKEACEGSVLSQASRATGGSSPRPAHSMRPSASAGPSMRTQSGR